MLRDRVGQTTTTAGTGPYELSGQLLEHRTLTAAGYADGDPVLYYVRLGNLWEANEGTLTVPGIGNPTLSRDRRIASSSGGVINWPDSSVKTVIVDAPAELFGPMGGRLLLGTLDGSSTVDAIVVNTGIETPALKDGMVIEVDLAGANTVTNPTFKLNGLTAKTIVAPDGSALSVGDLSAARARFSYKESLDQWLFMSRSFVGLITSAGTPLLELFRDITPTAGNELGQIDFTSRDDSSAKQAYAFIDAIATNPAAGSRDGTLRLVTANGGTMQAGLSVGNGVQVGSPAGGAQGHGMLNAGGLYLGGVAVADKVVNTLYGEYATNADLATTIPNDDTPPTSSEGTQIISIASVVVAAGQKVRLRGQIQCDMGTGNARGTIALFRGTTCIAATCDQGWGATEPFAFGLAVEETPGAGTYTYSMRVGGSSGTMRLNGLTTGRLFGGVSGATLSGEVVR